MFWPLLVPTIMIICRGSPVKFYDDRHLSNCQSQHALPRNLLRDKNDKDAEESQECASLSLNLCLVSTVYHVIDSRQ